MRYVCLVSDRIVTACLLLLWAIAVPLRATEVKIEGTRWLIDGRPVNAGSACEGLLMNVRMVNSTFEDRGRNDFDPDQNTDELIEALPDYASHGVNAITLCLQGGMPGYEGAINSAIEPDGSLRDNPMKRVARVIEACDRHEMVVILGIYYQRQSGILKDEESLRRGVIEVARWISEQGFRNVVVEIANEHPHRGFVHPLIRDPEGMASLIRLARQTSPKLLVTASGYGDGKISDAVAQAADFLTPHWNGTKVEDIPKRVATLQTFGKPIVCNEDDKTGRLAVAAMRASVQAGAAYGLMHKDLNQTFPFEFRGSSDDPVFYAALKSITSSDVASESGGDETDAAETVDAETVDAETISRADSPSAPYPPPESQGGWRQIESRDQIASVCGMDWQKLDELREWLLESDNRPFAAVVIRNGVIALQVERGNSAVTDSRRVASVSKAVCATVLAIASEQSQQGKTPRRMTFDDRAMDYLPWAHPLSDPRKGQITVKQLLNHTSGICPEALGAPNDGSWQYILGKTGDERTARLAFDPGTACGYSTHALAHAALVCENVTGMPYDQFAIEALFRPLGIESWWFQYYDGGEQIGRHPSHGLGMPARELARIGYCMLRGGRWEEQQVIPEWFVRETSSPTHQVVSPEMRWQLNPNVFSHGWELPANHFPESGKHIEGIPRDARYKPGSGGQLLAFVPSLDLVIARQTGGSGAWDYEEFLRRACDAVIPARP